MARLTQQAYLKGLEQGYALAKAQYEEILRDHNINLKPRLDVQRKSSTYSSIPHEINGEL